MSERNYLREYEKYREKKRIKQKLIEQKRIEQENLNKKKKMRNIQKVKNITYSTTIIAGIISTILSFIFLNDSEPMVFALEYGIAIIVLYFGGHFVWKINRWSLTKINAPLLVPIFLGVIVGYIDLHSMIFVFQALPMFITLSVLLLEKELLY